MRKGIIGLLLMIVWVSSLATGCGGDSSGSTDTDTDTDTDTEVTCDDDPCDENATCDDSGEDIECTCNDGFEGDGLSCTDIDECTEGTHDCDVHAECTNNPGGFDCACNNGWTGDGNTCSLSEVSNVLLLDDGNDTYADEAATSLGLTVSSVSSSSGFVTAYDAGGIDLIIIDSASNTLSTDVVDRLIEWINTGGRLIFGYWDLDAEAELAAALGVSVVSFSDPRDLYPDTTSGLDLFAGLTAPIGSENDQGDNGDELTPLGTGYVVGRFDSTSGPGAIVVSPDEWVIVNGFLSYDVGDYDGDTDSIPDMQELYTNEIVAVSAADCTPASLDGGTTTDVTLDGIMFDLVAVNDVIIDGFELVLITSSSTYDLKAYTKSGTYVGSESDSSAWTLAGTATLTPPSAGYWTSIGLDWDVPLAAGDTLGVYLTNSSGDNIGYQNYSSDFTNADLEIHEGAGVVYPFGVTYSGRAFEGTVHYHTCI